MLIGRKENAYTNNQLLRQEFCNFRAQKEEEVSCEFTVHFHSSIHPFTDPATQSELYQFESNLISAKRSDQMGLDQKLTQAQFKDKQSYLTSKVMYAEMM